MAAGPWACDGDARLMGASRGLAHPEQTSRSASRTPLWLLPHSLSKTLVSLSPQLPACPNPQLDRLPAASPARQREVAAALLGQEAERQAKGVEAATAAARRSSRCRTPADGRRGASSVRGAGDESVWMRSLASPMWRRTSRGYPERCLNSTSRPSASTLCGIVSRQVANVDRCA
eukprot:365294-Chlamydomonas_euryale.AAC.9